jgi:hypothetical protein
MYLGRFTKMNKGCWKWLNLGFMLIWFISCQQTEEEESSKNQINQLKHKTKESTTQERYQIESAKIDKSFEHLLAALNDTSAIKKQPNFKIIETDIPEYQQMYKAPNYYKFFGRKLG